MPICGKNTSNLLQNQESFEAEFQYIASGLNVYQACPNDYPRMTFDFLRHGQICVPIHLYGKVLKNHFLKLYERLMIDLLLHFLTREVKHFICYKIFVPRVGISTLAPGLCTCVKLSAL